MLKTKRLALLSLLLVVSVGSAVVGHKIGVMQSFGNTKKVFKVYCHANLDIRAQRTVQRDNISLNEAKQKIFAREQEENKVYKRLYGISELFNLLWIDLVVDTSFDLPEYLALKVIKAVRGL